MKFYHDQLREILRGILYAVLRTKQLDNYNDSELFLTLFQQPFEVNVWKVPLAIYVHGCMLYSLCWL